MAKANFSVIKAKTIQNNTNKKIIYNFSIFPILSLIVAKFWFAGVRQLSAKVLLVAYCTLTSIIWWSLVDATPARQRVPKLTNTNTSINHANPSGRSTLIGGGTQTNRQKIPNLGIIFPPNYDWCFI